MSFETETRMLVEEFVAAFTALLGQHLLASFGEPSIRQHATATATRGREPIVDAKPSPRSGKPRKPRRGAAANLETTEAVSADVAAVSEKVLRFVQDNGVPAARTGASVRIGPETISKVLGIAPRQVSQVLKDLIRAKRIERRGVGRSTWYVLAGADIERQVAEGLARHAVDPVDATT